MKILILTAACILTLSQFACKNLKNKAGHIKINDQGVNIAYTDNGKGDTTLLFVHGWCINKGYWSKQAAFFSTRYRVVTVDLPGFGKSGKNRKVWDAQVYGRDIDSAMSQLDLKNVVLIGHSMAGDIVLQAAVNAPARVIGLVGVDNFKNIGKIETEANKIAYGQAIDSLKHHFKQLAFEYVNQSLFYKTTADSIRKRVLDDVARADTVIAAACMEDSGFDEVKQLKAAKRKLYLINSDTKPVNPAGYKANNIPYQVFYIHATGHFPMIEKPLDFNAALQHIMEQLYLQSFMG